MNFKWKVDLTMSSILAISEVLAKLLENQTQFPELRYFSRMGYQTIPPTLPVVLSILYLG
jgi:hypothetical protein